MWPALFGPGWVWGALVALCLGGLLLGLIGFLLLTVNDRRRPSADPLEELWHRYEEGDLIREEFERRRREALERVRRAAGG